MNEMAVESSLDHVKSRAYRTVGVALLAIALLIVSMYDGLEYMTLRWIGMEEYSHGFILPVVALYLAWLRFNPEDIHAPNTTYWPGVGLVGLGVMLGLLGEMSAIFEVIQYGFIVAFYGVIIVTLGYRSFLRMLPPLLILFFMVPFPNFIYRSLSAQLQL